MDYKWKTMKAKDPERDKQIASAYLDGRTLAETGALFGISAERVRQILFRNGIRTGHSRTAGKVLAECEKVKGPINGADIARKTGFNAHTVRNIMRENSLKSEGIKARVDFLKIQAMITLYENGYSLKQVARLLNTEWTSVRYHLKRRGVTLRPVKMRHRKTDEVDADAAG